MTVLGKLGRLPLQVKQSLGKGFTHWGGAMGQWISQHFSTLAVRV